MKEAIIAGVFTICGFVINSLLNEFVDGRKFSREQKTFENKKKQELYVEFIKSMQNFMNNSDSREAFTEFQNSINILMLYASDSVIEAVNKYYKTMVKQSENKIITAKEHSDFQTNIINLMRQDINKKSIELDNIELIALRLEHKNIK